jgi:hypothetical protein
MATSDSDQVIEDEPAVEKTEDHRDAWLDLALVDMNGGAGALATAARGGRPLPKRDA